MQFVFLPLSYQGEYNIPDGITTISGGAFHDCTSLTSVINPKSVTSIGDIAFSGCTSLTSVVIPNSVTSIGYKAFSGCTSLTSVVIPNSVTSLDRTFINCSSLTSVIIPKSVTSIVGAFEGCSGLTDFYCYSETIPAAGGGFIAVPIEKATLHVPASLMESYKNIKTWRNFGHIVALPQINYIVDGKLYKASIFPSGDAVIAEPEPVRKGFTFSGWSEIPTIMPSEDWNVIGTFVRNKYILTYEVEGEEYGTREVEYQAVIKEEKAPEKEGYTFSGWQGLPETMPAENITARGSFTINKYKLTYKVDDKEYKLYEIEYGTNTIAEGEPSKEGYTFSGWSEIPATMPAKDVIIEGAFIPKKYTLTYIVDGETYKTYEMDCGAPLSIEPEPMKEGCTFSGWSEIPATMPARNLSIMGAFIQADDIQEILEDADTYQIYTIDGMPIEALQKGVNIIKYENGTVKKVVVK